MSDPPLNAAARHLQAALAVGGDDLTDRELLARYAAGDTSALARLVRRHGPLVYGVCRRALPDPNDADDAFQATFLALVIRSRSNVWRESVAGWLHEVATRVSAKARVTAARRANREREAVRMRPTDTPAPEFNDLAAVLDEELRGLPEGLRDPLVLCHLEGLTVEQTARRLGTSLRTIERRLSRGRTILARRLERRGVVPGIALLSAACSPPTAVAGRLMADTVRVAVAYVADPIAGSTPRITALALGALQAMRTTGHRLTLVALLTGGLLAASGVGAVARWAAPPQPAGPPTTQPKTNPPALAPAEAKDRHGDPLPPGAVARMGTTRLRQPGRIAQVGFSPDGSVLLAASNSAVEGRLYLWDPRTGKEIRYLEGHRPSGPSNNFATDARFTVIAGPADDNAIRLWDAGTGKVTPEVRMQPRFVAPDRVSTTLPPPFKSFFGTSAAAPHAAAAAALMLQADPGLALEQVYAALARSAADMDDPGTPGFDAGYDPATGYGLIRADRAVAAVRTTAISGHVYQEGDNDGRRDPAGPPLPGATVYLDRNNNGKPDAGEPTATTDARGDYLFAGLAPGRYRVRLAPPPGHASTAAPGGYAVTLASGQAFLADFTTSAVGAVTGRVVRDRNGDGALTPDEPGLAGVNVYIDRNGNGAFDRSTASYPSAGPVSVPAGTLGSVPVSVAGAASRVADVDVTFTLVIGNAAPGFQLLQVYLVSPSGTRVALTPSFVTALAPNIGFIDTTLDDEAAQDIGIAAAPYTGRFRPPAVSMLSSFDGEDPNGTWTLQVMDSTGAPVEVRSLTLHIFAADEPFTTTDARGDYTFGDLPPGTYSVGVQVPHGFARSSPAVGGYDITLAAGDRFAGDFGLRYAGTAAGRVVRDLDGDGMIEPGEPGVGGTTVYADLNGNGTFDRVSSTAAYAGPPVAFGGAGGSPLQVQIPLTVTRAAALVADANVTLDLSARSDEFFSGSLEVTLVSPTGKRVRLFLDAVAAGGATFPGTTFDDQADIPAGNAARNAAADAVVAYAGRFRPAEALTALAREPANGTWTLEVRNSGGSFALIGGVLRDWSLELTSTPDPFVTTDAAGDYDFTGVTVPAVFPLRVDDSTGFVTTAPGSGRYAVDLADAGPADRDFGVRRADSIRGTAFRDLDRDGARQPGEPALAGVAVFADANGNGTWDTNAFTSADVPKPIPLTGTGGSGPGGATELTTSTVAVSGAGTVRDLNVVLTLNHPYDEDLLITLVAPNGRRLVLAGGHGGTGNNYAGTLFDDEAETTLADGSAPFVGRFRPDQPLSAFDGLSADGTWTLEVLDQTAGDTGELVGWGLLVNPEPSATTDAAGNYEFPGLAPGTYRVVADAPPGLIPTAPQSGAATVELTAGDTAVRDFAFRDPTPPRVVDMIARWGGRSVSLLPTGVRPLPWVSFSSIDVVFSEDVAIDADDFTLLGVDLGPGELSVSYDPRTLTATLRLPPGRAFDRGEFTLVIDGDEVGGDGNTGVHDNPATATAGHYLDGGDVRIDFRVLPGDVTGNGTVDRLDVAAVSLFAWLGRDVRFADLNGEGTVDWTDVASAHERVGTRLP